MSHKLTEDSVAEFKGQIVDILEDYLQERGITLKSEERNETIREGDADKQEVAIIFGSLYDIIGDEIDYLIEYYNLFRTGSFSYYREETDAICSIADSYLRVLEEGGLDDETFEIVDWCHLRAKILEMFVNWELTPRKHLI